MSAANIDDSARQIAAAVGKITRALEEEFARAGVDTATLERLTAEGENRASSARSALEAKRERRQREVRQRWQRY